MGDADDVGRDYGDEGGQQEDNERVDVTTLGQLSDNFEPTFGYLYDKFGILFRQLWNNFERVVKRQETRSCFRGG